MAEFPRKLEKDEKDKEILVGFFLLLLFFSLNQRILCMTSPLLGRGAFRLGFY